jgi:hypothetical protein
VGQATPLSGAQLAQRVPLGWAGSGADMWFAKAVFRALILPSAVAGPLSDVKARRMLDWPHKPGRALEPQQQHCCQQV